MRLLKADPPAQVLDAFRDVQAATTDKETLQNQALADAGRVVREHVVKPRLTCSGPRATGSRRPLKQRMHMPFPPAATQESPRLAATWAIRPANRGITLIRLKFCSRTGSKGIGTEAAGPPARFVKTLGGMQEGARRDTHALIPGDHGAVTRQCRQDHYRQRGRRAVSFASPPPQALATARNLNHRSDRHFPYLGG